MRLSRLTGITATLALLLAGCSLRPGPELVANVTQDFIKTSLALQPVAATQVGYHQHLGVVLDEILDDYSPKAVQQQRAFYANIHARIDRMNQSKLTLEEQVDLDIIRGQCEAQLLEWNTLQSYRHNPTTYVELIGNAIYSPFVLKYAPEDDRIKHIIARLEKIPKFLDIAKKNLVDSPESWNEVAQQENQGTIELIDRTIREKIPEALRSPYSKSAAKAIASLQSFNTFLKNDLSKHRSDWRLGKEKYGYKFKYALDTGQTPEQTLKDAEAELQRIRGDMQKWATALYPKQYPGKTPPSDLNTLVSAVLDKIALQHTTPDKFFSDVQRDLAETTRFVRDHRLMLLPSGNNLQVIPTPEFMRGLFGVAGFVTAPPLEPKLGAFFWVTPLSEDKERAESKLREYNYYGLKILTIHEAMPGHYVQAEYANQIEPKWHRALRTAFYNNPYVEGWAVYATQLLIDEGYQPTPEMQLTFGKQMLRVVANAILDVRLHTMGMTDQQAIDLMIKDTFQEKEEATAKLQRAKLSSCQLPTYFAGWRGWLDIRDRYKKKNGAAFRLAEFHERALKEGGVPLPELSKLVLQ